MLCPSWQLLMARRGEELTKAVEWWTKAAEEFRCYEHLGGASMWQGVKNLTKAVEWFTKAAEGNSHAMYSLGMCFADGNGVEKNLTKAVEWWTKAAEKGNPML